MDEKTSSSAQSEGKQNRSLGTRWQPGRSGNPGGRPKKLPITDAIERELEREAADGITFAEAIAKRLIQMALRGNLDAIKLIFDRTEGKVRQYAGPAELEHEATGIHSAETREEVIARITELLRNIELRSRPAQTAGDAALNRAPN